MKINMSWFFAAFIVALFIAPLTPIYAADGYGDENSYYEESENNPVLSAALGAVIGGAVGTAALVSYEIKKHRPVRMAVDADRYISAGSAKMTSTEDRFLRTVTVQETIKK